MASPQDSGHVFSGPHFDRALRIAAARVEAMNPECTHPMQKRDLIEFIAVHLSLGNTVVCRFRPGMQKHALHSWVAEQGPNTL